MPTKPNTIRIFISSPGDVAEERALTRKVINRLQGEFSGQVVLEAIYWEHEPLSATRTFQEQIVRPSETDIVITILWSRLGTRLPAKFTRADGSRYESGTEYEFEDALQSYKTRGTPDLLIYRKTADPQVSLKDKNVLMDKIRQKEALDNFFDRWFHDSKEGTLIAAFHPFTHAAAFEELFESHLGKLIRMRLPEKTGADFTAEIKPVWREGSPFRGLSVFDFEHSPVFFGRTQAVSEIIEALRINSAAGRAFVLVLGMSGGGKSSLVRSGVLPMITQPGVIEGVGIWRRAIMKPGDAGGNLFNGLAAALLKKEALPELGADKTGFKELADMLRETPKAAVPLIKGGLSQVAAATAGKEDLTRQPTARMILVIDQMEELFTLKSIKQGRRKKFIEAIDALARSGYVWVIATLRSDFYPRIAELKKLVALKEGMGQYDLLSPTTAEFGQMIRQPALAAGLRFEEDPETNERLDDVLREATAKNPGALPLLEFTLEELYKRRTGNNVLTFEAYRKLGGVEGALAQRAEEVFAGLDPRVQKAMEAELHFLVSIDVDDEERISRKYASLGTVTATPETKAFIDAFVEARLFTTDLSADGSAVVYIAHEALLRQWPRLKDWVERNREELRIHARVSVAAKRWDSENRSREFLYVAGKQVNEAEELVKNKKIDLTETELAFVRASISKRRRLWWLKRAIAVALILLTIAATSAAYFALQESERARREAQTAEQVSDFLVGLFKVSNPVEARGDSITVREVLDRGAEKIKNELDDQPEIQATLMSTMGSVYRELGLYEPAVSLLEEALEIMRQHYGNNHPEVASSINLLGGVYLDLGNCERGEALFTEALAIRRKIYGNEHADVAKSLADLSYILDVCGEDSLAEVMLRESLAIRRKVLEETHPSISSSLNNLGYLAYEKGNYPEAIALFSESLEIRRKIYSGEHPTIATALNNLAALYNLMGDFARAEEYYTESLNMRVKIYGEEHPTVAQSISNLGTLYRNKGYYEKAEENFRRALVIRRKVFGDEHAEVALNLNYLGAVYEKQGNYAEAETLYREALGVYTRLYGDDHPDVAMCLHNLSKLYRAKGEDERAEELAHASMTILRNQYGNDHPLVAKCEVNLGLIKVSMGQYEEAGAYYQSALSTQQQKLPADHWQIAVTQGHYGNCLTLMNRYPEAELLLLESHAALESKFGAEDERTTTAVEYLVDLYTAWNKPEKKAAFEALLTPAGS